MKSLPTPWFQSFKQWIVYHWIMKIAEEAHMNCHWNLNFYDNSCFFPWAYLWSIYMGRCIVPWCTSILPPNKWYKIMLEKEVMWIMPCFPEWISFSCIVILLEIGLPGTVGPQLLSVLHWLWCVIISWDLEVMVILININIK